LIVNSVIVTGFAHLALRPPTPEPDIAVQLSLPESVQAAREFNHSPRRVNAAQPTYAMPTPSSTSPALSPAPAPRPSNAQPHSQAVTVARPSIAARYAALAPTLAAAVSTTAPFAAPQPSGEIAGAQASTSHTAPDTNGPDTGQSLAATVSATPTPEPTRTPETRIAQPFVQIRETPAPQAPPPAAHVGPTRAAKLVRKSIPAYPPSARRDGIEGTVHLRVAIDINGAVTGVELVSTSGDRRLDNAAVQEVANWRYSPRLEDGAPVATTKRETITFTLTEE
jgi:protein TonB